MNLGETVIYCGLEKAFLCEISLFGLHVSRNGFSVNNSCTFPQDVLATITLTGGVVGVGETKIWARCEVRPLCSMAIASLSGTMSALPANGMEDLRVVLKKVLFPCKIILFLLPELGSLSQRRRVLK